MQWHGSEGFLNCDGTTKEQALENGSLHEKIVRHEDVMAFYGRFTLEDDNFVVLNSSLALEHVRQCLNDLKRQRVTSGLVFENCTVLGNIPITILVTGLITIVFEFSDYCT